MTVVRDPAELLGAFRQTRASALALFGDPGVYVERYLDQARHIEVQILADQHGNAIHLGLRDCSVQRRRQKLIEETPPARLSPDLADAMGKAAVKAALAAGYQGAGTFEFLVDTSGGFYFMEANCRIQVEHPVTEATTGIDLVREQLRIASGLPLVMRQEDVAPRGCAIECRINAEDPAADFAPTAGRIDEFSPAAGPFTRVDTHGYPGMLVSADYDPLIAKVIVWGPDREQALQRMDRALAEFRISSVSVRTTAEFLRTVLRNPEFVAARHTTALVDHLARTPSEPSPAMAGAAASSPSSAELDPVERKFA
jgi:acetyl-CoA carboxylase biotin carboxylase subunit